MIEFGINEIRLDMTKFSRLESLMMSDGSLEDRRVLENVFGGLVCVPTPLKPHLEVIFPVALFVNQLSTVQGDL